MSAFRSIVCPEMDTKSTVHQICQFVAGLFSFPAMKKPGITGLSAAFKSWKGVLIIGCTPVISFGYPYFHL